MIVGLRRRTEIGAALAAAALACVTVPAAAAQAHRSSTAATRAHSDSTDGQSTHGTSARQGTPKMAVRALTHLGGVSRYAFVDRPTRVWTRPSFSSRRVATLQTGTFWGTSAIVLALEQASAPDGRGSATGTNGSAPADGGWTQVRAPDPPSDVVGWVPSSALSPLQSVHTWLRVDRERLTATLIRDGRIVFRAPVGVGQPQWPTPAGQFFVEESITPTEYEGMYGAFAFGTSAHSSVLTEWPNEGQIGIHGTNEPWLIPGRISHGCIRLRNPDILRLARLMPVGTPITVD